MTYEEICGRDVLDFSANVSPLGLPASVKEAVCASLEAANRYPDPECRRLRRAISDKYGLFSEYILCGNGAADLIYRLAYAIKPQKALVPAPDFQEYEEALRQVGCDVVYWELMRESVPAQKPGMSGLPAPVLEDDVEMVILSNPNNPSGLLYSRDALEKLLIQCEERNVLLVADECFMDFVACRERCTLLSLVERHRSLCVLRAFTKFYGMAGLRLGWCATSNRELLERMEKAGPPWSVSMPAQAAGIAALGNEEYEVCLREMISMERCRMQEKLRDLGFFVLPGEANFILFHTDRTDLDYLRSASSYSMMDHTDKMDLADRLMERGFAIRDCSNYRGLGKGWFRAAVRLREENEALMEAVRHLLTERSCN